MVIGMPPGGVAGVGSSTPHWRPRPLGFAYSALCFLFPHIFSVCILFARAGLGSNRYCTTCLPCATLWLRLKPRAHGTSNAFGRQLSYMNAAAQPWFASLARGRFGRRGVRFTSSRITGCVTCYGSSRHLLFSGHGSRHLTSTEGRLPRRDGPAGGQIATWRTGCATLLLAGGRPLLLSAGQFPRGRLITAHGAGPRDLLVRLGRRVRP